MHDKLTFTAEYCRARRIPYRIVREALFVDKQRVCFSLYNLTFEEILRVVDKFCVYNPLTLYFERTANDNGW